MTIEELVLEISDALQDLSTRLGEENRAQFFSILGLPLPDGLSSSSDLKPVLTAVEDGASAAQALTGTIESLRKTLSSSGGEVDLNDLRTTVEKVVRAVKSIETAIDDADAAGLLADLPKNVSPSTFAKRAAEYIVLRHLETKAPEVLYSLYLLSVADLGTVYDDQTDLAYRDWRLRLDRISGLLQEPVPSLRKHYESTSAESLRPILHEALSSTGIPARWVEKNQTEYLRLFSRVDVAVPSVSPLGIDVELAEKVSQASKTITLDTNVLLTFEVETPLDDVTFKIRQGQPIAVTSSSDVDGHVGAELRRTSTNGPFVVLGTAGGSRIEGRTARFGAGLDVSKSSSGSTPPFTAALELFAALEDARLVVSLEKADGFISKVLPIEKSEVPFSLGVRWSTDTGLQIEGSAGLTAKIGLQAKLGPAKLNTLTLGVEVGDGAPLSLESSVSGGLQLGPLAASVDRIGLEGALVPQKDQPMPFDVDLGFKPPSGLGLSVDASAITGGGYLAFYPEEHRYSGTFELQITNLGVTVVGLLKTKLPESEGFSLLLLITADLPPVQLGFGFVMTGIGGLGGVNRGFEEKPLGKAIRAGNVRSVLFPKNVVANANQIITDLRSFFPARADQHVFGPMLEVGWGTPTVLQMQLSILVSIPTWKIALVGNITMALPDEKAGLIVLNLAVLGVLDLPNQELSIDASLYDSRVVQWTVSGDMSMRLSYGPDPRFLLSVGGFHPRYSPPTGFPSLRRVKASISPPGGNPRLELTGYLAVTSNTFQVGAKVTLAASAGPARVFGQLGFDALFRFNPFSFVIDFYATLKVQIKGKGLSISVDGTLSGPRPFRVKGKIKISILFFSVTVRVNAQIGPGKKKTEKLPVATVLPEIRKQVATPGNWTAQQPDEETQWIRLRDRHADEKNTGKKPDSDLVLAHPLGTLGVRQQVAPLETRLEKYGNARPAHEKYAFASFDVKNADPAKNLDGEKHLTEKFAPAKFRKMSDEEKLEAEAFEDLPAGRTLENGLLHVAGESKAALRKEATLDFEATAIDETNGESEIKAGDLPEGRSWASTQPSEIGQELKKTSRVATGGMRTEGRARYRNDRDPNKLSVSDDRYVVVHRSTMKRLEISGNATKNPASGQPRVQALDTKKEYLDDHPDERGTLQVVATSEVAG